MFFLRSFRIVFPLDEHCLNFAERSFCYSGALFVSDKPSQHDCVSSQMSDTHRQGFRDALEVQGAQRRERRKAFLQWQAGQREKGAAHRLLRLARIAESNKRHHYHRQRGRLLGVSCLSRDKYKYNENESKNNVFSDSLLSPLRTIPKREK